MEYVYILECSDKTLYTGYTNDLEKRVKTHNEGKGAKYTRGRLPVKLLYSEAFDSKSLALKREYSIKQKSKEDKLALIKSQNNLMQCLLCKNQSKLFKTINSKKYYKCNNCSSVMLCPKDYISAEEEKKRYLTHNNDVEDKRYQKFTSPITNTVKKNFTTNSIGLDYGAGTGPVITSQLNKSGYKVNLYDPFFHPHKENLKTSYDYIISCEVIEHFHNPSEEFERLNSLLKPKGKLILMTDLYDKNIDFENWYYKNDETHVFFYHKEALNWIKKKYNFKQLKVDKRLIVFSK